MKVYFFAVLLLGCVGTIASIDRGLYEFYDSHGRCWRCLPGKSCVRCSSGNLYSNFPDPWNRECPYPSNYCDMYPGAKFPSLNINFYWICADGEIALVPCPCETAFDMRLQECVIAENITSIGCTPYDHSDIAVCGGNPGDIPTPPTTVDPPTAPIDTTTSTPPTAPTDGPTDGPTDAPTTTSTVTQPPPGDTTRTTESGGDGASPQTTSTTDASDSDGNTTPPPCVCVVWWPCWCNPCWNMPCHSCQGCVNMVG